MPVTPFPAPRSLTTTPGGAALDAPVRTRADPALPPQGYRLRTGTGGVSIDHRDALGLRYALSTLDQLRAGHDYTATGYDIRDHPDFPVRGFLLDISRDRVPTRRTLARWIEILSLARFTQLELYTEHTYAFRDQQDVWQDASPLTADDLRWLDARCAAAGIELVANQNTFGHMERFLRHPRHLHRAENPEGFERGGVHRPPSTLEPTDDNAAFATALVAEVTREIRSRRLNIGADEPFELGRGRSARRVAEQGTGEVYFSFVTRLMAPWLEAGYTVEFWADVFADHPGLMDRVPPGAVPVVWQYDGPRLLGEVIDGDTPEARTWQRLGADLDNLREGFRSRGKLLSQAGVPFWVAPGASNWNALLGRIDNAVDNMLDAAETGRENDAEGFLLTSWGDHGHWDAPSVAFGPVVFGGAVSWSLEANRDLDIAAVLDDHVLLDGARLTGGVLTRLGRVYRDLGVPLLNGSPIARALFPDPAVPLPSLPEPEAMDRVAATLTACRTDLDAADPAAADGDVVRRELRHAVALAEFALDVLRARAAARAGTGTVPDADAIDPATARRLLRRIDPLLGEQRACWLLRSRPGGLDDSIGELDRLRHQLGTAAHA
ncbi:glycoside hydrolase family 20 zincin-like fold domain-containing protein [Streptomyces sp. ID01-9D]|uniref:glycoside hydrolase family 20 zincin-like fold domain-containing protein n=1 Tax=Streptomyces sp. ID01-9D TaxID=3028659 RepID=UPI0029C1085C|nr:glycoside hydrolase family 20 zincin-like fold domain-containing protein [Streptomyces sp. ID01-9D]MDX5573444.1 glycoside hydrolase family 20 zincin-like fold domain-containing protein [Streptomyces sp. ID01-9D]